MVQYQYPVDMLKLLVPPRGKRHASEGLPILVLISRLSPWYGYSPDLQKMLKQPPRKLHSGVSLLQPGLYLEAVFPVHPFF
jgi:hypothetical protein